MDISAHTQTTMLVKCKYRNTQKRRETENKTKETEGKKWRERTRLFPQSVLCCCSGRREGVLLLLAVDVTVFE